MKDYRKMLVGLLMGLPYLWSSHSLVMAAITQGRDLTATGVAVGAISAGVVGILGVFVYGNIKERQTT